MPTISGLVTEYGVPLAGRVVRAYRRDTGAFLGSTLSGAGVTVPGDPNYSNVALLLHLDDMVDTSPSPKTATLNSGALLSSTAAKYGVSGLQINTGGGLTVPSNPAFALPGDFTFECNVFVRSWSPPLASLFNIGTFAGGALFRVQANILELWINGVNTNVTASVGLNTWRHLAWSRQGNTVRVFMDGVLRGTVTNGGAIAAGNVLVGVSAHAGGEYLNGYLDEIRLTLGVARYTDDFTPPSGPHPNTDSALTQPLGAYTLTTSYTGEVQVVCLDNAEGDVYNDLILRTTPV